MQNIKNRVEKPQNMYKINKINDAGNIDKKNRRLNRF